MLPLIPQPMAYYNIYEAYLERYDFVHEGYEEYRRQADEQFDIRWSGEYLCTIVSGLQHLGNLEQVTISDTCQSRSPFGRSWPREYLTPRVDSMRDSADKTLVYQHDHKLLVRALSISGRKLKSLVMDLGTRYGVPIRSFDGEVDLMTKSRHILNRHIKNVYCNLKVLHLVSSIDFSRDQHSLSCLRSCLAEIRGLTNLHLELTKYSKDDSSFLSVISNTAWPHLIHMSISFMSVEGEDLIHFLSPKHSLYPYLQSFTMGNIMLTGIHWFEVLDDIRACMPKAKNIFISGPLIYQDGGKSWENLERANKDLKKQIESYLESGGVNPLLTLGR